MARQDPEPTVEEILASIKKVIAHDGRQAALSRREKLVPREPEIETGEEDEDEDSILELTDDLEPLASDEEHGDALVGEGKRDAMRESLAALSTLSEPSASPKIVQSGETSLEGMVRDLLRPMLAEWLDQNLPDIVETMVAREISRITRKD